MIKRAPLLLASLFVLLSIVRVGTFVEDVLAGGFLAWVFAVALAAAVGISGWCLARSETRWAGIAGLVLCGPSDLILNLLELIRTTSAAQIIPPASNFLGLDTQTLTYSMQGGALLFGGLQSAAAAVLGWQAASIEKIPVPKRVFLPRLQRKILAAIDSLFPVEKTAAVSYAAAPNGGFSIQKRGKRRGEEVRRNELRAGDKDRIAGMDTRQIVASFGGSPRRAREWKEAAENGEL